MPTSDGAAYSSIAMGRGLMPRSFMIEATVATSPGIFDDLVSSCQAMMSGTVSVATAFSRNLRMSLMLSEKLGPWIGVVASSERTWRKVRVQKSSYVPLDSSHVLSDSFQSSHAARSMSSSLIFCTCCSTTVGQVSQLNRYGQPG